MSYGTAVDADQEKDIDPDRNLGRWIWIETIQRGKGCGGSGGNRPGAKP
jgi:hypothetical protein